MTHAPPSPPPTLAPEPSVSAVVRGLSPDAHGQPVDGFFDRFPWTPSLHVRLSQWETRTFFDRFLP